MNMTNVLHRRSHAAGALRPSIPDSLPPSQHPPTGGDGPPAAWPTSARVWAAILFVAALLLAVGVAVAAASSDDRAVEQQLRDQVAAVTAERDDALDAVEEIDGELATVRQQLEAAQTSNDELFDRSSELEAQVETLSAERDQALATVDQLTATVDELEAAIADLERQTDALDAAVQTANQRVAAAVAERDSLAKLFPITFDASLVGVDMVRTYGVGLTKVHCTGPASCDTVPAIKELTIKAAANGDLLVTIPQYVDGGLSRTGGALHMIAHSTTALPKCAGNARTAEVSMTIFPGSYRIADDGARTVVTVGGVLTVEAPAVGDCPAALAFYHMVLTPKA